MKYAGKELLLIRYLDVASTFTYLKSAIQEIDESAFIVVSDCYEVLGGTKKKKLSI